MYFHRQEVDLPTPSGTRATYQTFISSSLLESRSSLLAKCLRITISTSSSHGNQTNQEGITHSRTSFRSLQITKISVTRSTLSRNIKGRRPGAQEVRQEVELEQAGASTLDNRYLQIRCNQSHSSRIRDTSKLNFLRLA